MRLLRLGGGALPIVPSASDNVRNPLRIGFSANWLWDYLRFPSPGRPPETVFTDCESVLRVGCRRFSTTHFAQRVVSFNFGLGLKNRLQAEQVAKCFAQHFLQNSKKA